MLKKIGVGLWHKGRGLAIDFLGDLIKILMGLDPFFDSATFADEEMEMQNVNSKIGEWFKKVWAKVKAFFDNLGHQIKEFFDNLGKKIKEEFEKLFPAELRKRIVAALKKFKDIILAKLVAIFNKYKDLIISALIKDGKAILDEAMNLLVSVIEGLAKAIIDAIHAIVGPTDLFNDDVDMADNGIKDIWEKVKAAVKEYFVSRINEFKKMGPKYKATAEDLLKQFEKLSLHQLKNMGVDFLGDLIKIIMGQDPEAVEFLLDDEEFEVSAVNSKISDWFKKAWAKVKAFFDNLGHQIKEFFDNLGKKIKEEFDKLFPAELRKKIVAALKKFKDIILAKLEEIFNKYKDLIISALKKDGKVILDEAVNLVVSVIEGLAKAIIDAIHAIVGPTDIFNDDVDLADIGIKEYDTTIDSIADCVKAEKVCMNASTGVQKVKCLIDLATCVGGETAKCAQKCGPPAVSCVKDAIFGGKVADIPKCFQTFVKCAADCSKSGEMDLFVDAAIQDFHEKFPQVESIADCVKAEKDCMSASTGMEKVKCLIDLATCVGGETAKCAQKCG